MKRLTFRAAKTDLSRIAGASGMRVNDERFLTRLNRAIEEMMNAGDWAGILDRYRFTAYGGIITLPGDLNSIKGVAVNGSPIQMVSPWYEFHADGPGPQDSQTWIDNAIDRGESCTFQPIPDAEPMTLQVVTQLDERVGGVRPKIIIRGYDELGTWVRSEINSQQADGIALELNGDAGSKQSDSPITFTSVESVIKPRTKGYVHLYAFDGTTRYHLATYAPNEEFPSYRRYIIPFLDPEGTHRVVVRARKRFIPVAHDDDFLLITNMNALETMLLALQKREADDIGAYWNKRKAALQLLREETRSYRDNTAKPAITFAQGFGMGSIPHIQ